MVTGSSRHMVRFFPSRPSCHLSTKRRKKLEKYCTWMSLPSRYRRCICQRVHLMPERAKRKAMKAYVLNMNMFRKALCFWTWISSFNLPACILPPRLEGLIQNRTNLRTPLGLVFLKCFTLYKRGIEVPNAITVHPCHVSNWPPTFDTMECESSF